MESADDACWQQHFHRRDSATSGVSLMETRCDTPGFVSYSGAAPILVPVSLLPHWHGFYLRAGTTDVAELEIPAGRFKICSGFDFKDPKTDYDRACSLGGIRPVHLIRVGRGMEWSLQLSWTISPGGRNARCL